MPKAFNQGTRIERVTVTVLPKRSVAVKVSIDPPLGKVRVDEKSPFWSWNMTAPFSIIVEVRSVFPRTFTMPLGNGALFVGEAMNREGPANSGHASIKP